MAAKFVRVVDENHDKLHTLYWIPTLYKRLLLQFLVHFYYLDWLQSLKQFFINVSYHILAASLTLMALF